VLENITSIGTINVEETLLNGLILAGNAARIVATARSENNKAFFFPEGKKLPNAQNRYWLEAHYRPTDFIL
jgi:hypothetical protein